MENGFCPSTAPENGWVEDDPFLLGFGCKFQGGYYFKLSFIRLFNEPNLSKETEIFFRFLISFVWGCSSNFTNNNVRKTTSFLLLKAVDFTKTRQMFFLGPTSHWICDLCTVRKSPKSMGIFHGKNLMWRKKILETCGRCWVKWILGLKSGDDS